MSLTTLTAATEIMMEQHKRGGIPKMPYECGPSQSLIDGGYCLDAPDTIPAGGHYNFEIADCGWVPADMVVWREPGQ